MEDDYLEFSFDDAKKLAAYYRKTRVSLPKDHHSRAIEIIHNIKKAIELGHREIRVKDVSPDIIGYLESRGFTVTPFGAFEADLLGNSVKVTIYSIPLP